MYSPLFSFLVVRVARVSEPASVVNLHIGAHCGHISAVAGAENGLLPTHFEGFARVLREDVCSYVRRNRKNRERERERKREGRRIKRTVNGGGGG